jgi:hypothetical protein
MKTAKSFVLLLAAILCSASAASAGYWSCTWDRYVGHHHDACFNRRFLERPYPPYHGWNRPFYGWSSNYRPYYFTPQPYANTPWSYGPYNEASIYESAAPTPGLNSYGVPVQQTSASSKSAYGTAPTPAAPTLAPPVAPMPATPPPPPMPEVPPPPKPTLK